MSLELICSVCGGPLMDGDTCVTCGKMQQLTSKGKLAEGESQATDEDLCIADLMLEGDLFSG